jgi:hypothetical protein
MQKVKVQEWSINASNLDTAFRRRGIHFKDHFLLDKQKFLSITAVVLDNTFFFVYGATCFDLVGNHYQDQV